MRGHLAALNLFLFASALPAYAGSLDELRDEARGILEVHCARCHQADQLEGRSEPASNFGNVLDLTALVRDKKYVFPGNPDNSKMWQLIEQGLMPYDIMEGDFSKGTPSTEETALLAEWIRAEGEAVQELVSARTFVTDDAILDAISDDLRSLPTHRAPRTRYFSLANLHNGGATAEAMEVYRQAVVKLLNSLTYAPDPIMYEKLGPDDTILRVNLDDLNWDEAVWETIQRESPFALHYDNPISGFITGQTQTDFPIMRADFFAFAASRPPLYHQLLELPESIAELERLLGVDMNRNIESGRALRAGFQKSGVSQNNRLIERHPSEFGAFWNSYDFAGNQARQSLFLHPLGPEGDNAFRHDGGEIIFSLPNGMQGYFLAAAKGNRIDSGPTEIVRDNRRADLKVTNGISCMSCHVLGIRDENQDEIREYILASAGADRHTRDTVEKLYPPEDEMKQVMARDKERFLGAMRAAGLDPNLTLDQNEMISALSDQYERNLTLEMASAEFGLTAEEFESKLPRAGQEGFDLARRLKQDQVPRDQFSGLYPKLVEQLTDNRVASDGARPAHGTTKLAQPASSSFGSIDLALFADKDDYRVDDLAEFTVLTDTPCYLTLINVDGAGTSTMLLPNRFRPDPVLISPTGRFTFPSDHDGFQFRLADKGVEKVIALCSPDEKSIPGMIYDFSMEAFAAQGSENSMNRSLRDAATRKIIVESSASNRRDKALPVPSVGHARKAIVLQVE